MLEDNRVNLQEVKVGKRVANQYVVLDGLQEGQQIVMRDVVALVNQQVVTVQY